MPARPGVTDWFARNTALVLNLLLVLLVPLALVNVARAFQQGTQPLRGEDFQWSGTRLILNHVDPWQEELAGNPSHARLLNQVPNYLHETYLLLIPYAELDFPTARKLWIVTNCLLSLASLWILSRFFNLRGKTAYIVALAYFSSYPFRTAVGNGQQCILELLAFCCAFCLTALPARGLGLGLSYLKYSFSPVFVFYVLCKRWGRMLLISLLPPLLGLIGVWAFVRTPIATLAVEPLIVSKAGIVVFGPDLMSITLWLAALVFSAKLTAMLSYVVSVAAAALYAFHLSRSRFLTPLDIAACLATASLILLRHGGYDFVFLAVPLANTARLYRMESRLASSAILAFMFYGERLVTRMNLHAGWLLNFALVVSLLYIMESDALTRSKSSSTTDDTAPRPHPAA